MILSNHQDSKVVVVLVVARIADGGGDFGQKTALAVLKMALESQDRFMGDRDKTGQEVHIGKY